jgi:hypothetical protein
MSKICKVEGCTNPVHGNDYCQKHYNQIKKHGRLLRPEEERPTKPRPELYCEVCNISNNETRVNFRKRFNMYLCEKHNAQMKINGKILDETFLDPNKYFLYEDYAEIILCNYQCEEITRAMIDLEDVERCQQYKWCLTTNDYVVSNVNGQMIKLHRFIMDILDNDDVVIDHEDRNPLNNRKYNLRICTNRENTRYKGIQSNNTSGVIGVNYVERVNKWRAYITPNKKQIFLGYYDDIENATTARLQAELRYYGKDFSPQKNLFMKYNII